MDALKYTWRPATGTDIDAIINLSVDNFAQEVDGIFRVDPIASARNLTLAVVNQFYAPTTELISVAVDTADCIVAWTWAHANQTTSWSDERMTVVKMAHVSQALSTRDRVRLINDMIALWEGFAHFASNDIVCSITMRESQDTFLRLHERAGYRVRGSYAYKRLTKE